MTHQVKFQRSLISCYVCALCVGVGYPITIRFSFFVSLTANSSHHHSRRHTEWRKWKDIDYLSPLVVYSCRRYFFFFSHSLCSERILKGAYHSVFECVRLTIIDSFHCVFFLIYFNRVLHRWIKCDKLLDSIN